MRTLRCSKSIYAEVENSLRRVVAREVEGEAMRGVRSTLRKLPVPILVVGGDDDVLAMSHSAEEILRGWGGGPELSGGLPDDLRHACASLRTGKAGLRTLRGGSGRTATVRWLEGYEGKWIRVEFGRIGRRADGRTNLTAEDRRLVGLLVTGLKDAEIAEISGRSVSLVKADLRALYARHCVRSRAELLAAVL